MCASSGRSGRFPRVLYAYHQHGGTRVTGRAGLYIGRQRFLQKHAESMSPACRLYHRAVIGQLTGGRKGVAEQLGAEWRTPLGAGLAATVLAASAAASSIGTRRHDPGLPARLTVARLLGARAGRRR